VVRRDRGEKLVVFKYGPKTRRRVKKGHRQDFTLLRVTDVRLGKKSAAKSAKKAETDAKTERQRLEEAAAAQAAKDLELVAKLADKAGDGPAPTTGKAKSGSKKPARSRAKDETTETAETTDASETAAEAPDDAETAKPAKATKATKTRNSTTKNAGLGCPAMAYGLDRASE
jgi:large subunit ribosomal protein L21